MSSIEGFEERFFSAVDQEVMKGTLPASDRDAVKSLFLRIKGTSQEAELPSLLEKLSLSDRSLKILRQNLEGAHEPRMPLPKPIEDLQPLALQVQELLAQDNHAVAENLFFHQGPSGDVVVTQFARQQGLLRNRLPAFEEATHELKKRLEEAIPFIEGFVGDRTALKDVAFFARSFLETTDEYARRWSRVGHQAQKKALFENISSKICLSPKAQEFYETLYSELAFTRMGRTPGAVARRALKRGLPEPEPFPGQEPPPPLPASPPAVRRRAEPSEPRAPTPPPSEPVPMAPSPPVRVPTPPPPERMEHTPGDVPSRPLERGLPEPFPGQEPPPPLPESPPAVGWRAEPSEPRAPTPPPSGPVPMAPSPPAAIRVPTPPPPESTFMPPGQPAVFPGAESPEWGQPAPSAPPMPLPPQGEAPAPIAPTPEVPERTGFNALLLPEGEKVPDLSPTVLQNIDRMTGDLSGLQRGIVRGYIKARANEQMTDEAIFALRERALRVSLRLPETLHRYIDVVQGVLGKYRFNDEELSSIAEHLVLHFATVPALAVQIKAMLLIDSLQCLIDRPETIRGGYIVDKRDAWRKVVDVLKRHPLWRNTLDAIVERKSGATFVPLAVPHPRDFPHFTTVAEALGFLGTKARWPVL